MTNQGNKRVLIIGGGVAAYTAALYTGRAGLATTVLCGATQGGQLTIAGEVENFPGFPQGVSGVDLGAACAEQAERFGAESLYETAAGLRAEGGRFVVTTDEGEHSADAVIVATGSRARWLGVPGEREFAEKGVSACATCDGFFFKGRDVVVVGGGNTAVEEAIHLSKLCSSVTLVHRRDTLRAETILIERLKAIPNVSFVWNATVSSIGGTDVVDHVVVNDADGERTLKTDGVFVAIGHDPATAALQGVLELDESGYVVTAPGGTQTSLEGVFAAGDVADPVYRQAVTAAGSGCKAALDAEKWLSIR